MNQIAQLRNLPAYYPRRNLLVARAVEAFLRALHSLFECGKTLEWVCYASISLRSGHD